MCEVWCNSLLCKYLSASHISTKVASAGRKLKTCNNRYMTSNPGPRGISPMPCLWLCEIDTLLQAPTSVVIKDSGYLVRVVLINIFQTVSKSKSLGDGNVVQNLVEEHQSIIWVIPLLQPIWGAHPAAGRNTNQHQPELLSFSTKGWLSIRWYWEQSRRLQTCYIKANPLPEWFEC